MKNIKIQNIIMQYNADVNFRYMPELFIQGKRGEVSPLCYDAQKKCHIIKALEIADFNTYFNCLQISKWLEYTSSQSFQLHIVAKGKFQVEILEHYVNSMMPNLNSIKTLSFNNENKEEVIINIDKSDKPLIGFNITALENTEVYSAWYSANVEDNLVTTPRISLVTTTFKKQQYIKRNIERIKQEALFEGSDLKGHLFVHVIDNESALDPKEFDSDDLKVYPNMNVGGAGGFTRGMIEAMELEEKPTHVLLMDDDVLVMVESLFRLYYLLRIVKKDYNQRFVSGAMFDYDFRERQYEDVGYVNKLDASYGPVKPTLDMRDIASLLKNDSVDGKGIANKYAGWWFCCIPMKHIEERGLPLPVFIRGDDVEFSIRNNPGFLTMNGISVWHVGFAGKFNAAMELYQVHRNSLIIQATSGICKDIDFMKRIKTQFWREITRFAYGNAELLLDSVEDYLRGPEYLITLNGEKSLKEHMAKNEILSSGDSIGYPQASSKDVYEYTSLNIIAKIVYMLTINGHLLPNFMLRRYPSFISFDWFFVPGKNFLRQNLVAVNSKDGTACLRRINRKKCFKQIKRYILIMNRYKKCNTGIENQYRQSFAKMTSVDFWKEYLKYE